VQDGARAWGETPFGDQEAVGRNAKRGVMVEAAPSAPLVVPETNFLFEVLVVPIDAPPQFRRAWQRRGTRGGVDPPRRERR